MTYNVFSGTLNPTQSIHLSPHQVTTLSSLHPSGHSLWSRNMVPYLTTREDSGYVWPVVSAAYILRISWTARISAEEVRWHTDQPPLTRIIRTTRLKFFRHTARADPSMDHSRDLRPHVAPLPRDWNRRLGWPCHTWLWPVGFDLAPLKNGLTTAYHWAQNRQAWNTLVGTATSSTGPAHNDDDDDDQDIISKLVSS